MPPTKSPSQIRRVVTGHDSHDNAIIWSDGALSTVRELDIIPGTVFHEVWSTQGTPALIDNGADPTTGALVLAPPRGGTRIRFVDTPPETDEFHARDVHSVEEAFGQIGAAGASTARAGAPHPQHDLSVLVNLELPIGHASLPILARRQGTWPLSEISTSAPWLL